MLVVVFGSRSIGEYAILNKVMWDWSHVCEITGIISGMARGVDTLAVHWAESHGIPLLKFPADWDGLGMGAGFARNRDMAMKADGAVCLWDGKSAGTRHMLQLVQKKDIPYILADQHGKIYQDNG